MRKRKRDLAETVLLALGVFTLIAVSVAWPFMLQHFAG